MSFPRDVEDATPPHSPPLNPLDEQRQILWEHQQVRRGIERYRSSLQKVTEDGGLKRKALADLEPGQVIARELMAPMVARLEDEQERVVEVMSKPNTQIHSLGIEWTLCALPAETLAAVAVLTALSYTHDISFTAACRAVGGRVKDELDLLKWVAAERGAAKERKDNSALPWEPNMVRLMKQRNKVVDKRVFDKWSKKSPRFAASEWSVAVRVAIGAHLLGVMVEANAWFEVRIDQQALKKSRVLCLSDIGREWVLDRHNNNELMRPYLLPMVAEPRDYVYA